MEADARRGLPLSLLSYAGHQAIRLVATVILTRILVPADFGLLALCSLAIGVLSIFNDFGLGSAAVIRPELDERTRGTVLSIMLLSSAALAVVLIAASPLIADLYGQPRLGPLLMVISGSLFLSGPIWFYETTFQRDLQFGRRLASKLTLAVAYLVSAVTLALLGAGVWSLVIGHVISYAAQLVVLVALAPTRTRPRWDGAEARDLIRSSRGFLVWSGVEFMQQNTDSMVVGRVLGARALGFYGLSFRLSELPWAGVAHPVANVTFPAFSRMRHRGEEWRRTYLTTVQVIALVCAPLGALLSGCAEPLTRTLFNERWLPVIPPLQIFGLWAVLRPIEATVAWMLNALDLAGRVARISGSALLVLVPALIVAADRGGIDAVAWVMAGHMAVLLAALVGVAHARAGVTVADHVRAVAPASVSAMAAWVAARAVVAAMDDVTPPVTLAASVVVALAVYGAGVAVLDRSVVARVRAHLRRLRAATETAPVEG